MKNLLFTNPMRTFLYGLCAALFLSACGSEVQVIQPGHKQLREAVYASGKLQSKDQYELRAPLSGTVTEVIGEGIAVQQGEQVIAISHEAGDAQLSSAATRLQHAKQNLDASSQIRREMQAELANAGIRLSKDSIEYARQQELLANKATSQVAYENALNAWKQSKNDLIALRARQEQRLQQLQENYRQAQADYSQYAEQKANTRLSSTLDGKVYKVLKRVGEQVQAGELLAIIGRDDAYELLIQVDERDISKVKAGQPIYFSTDLYEAVFTAEVARISPFFNESDRTFLVEGKLTEKETKSFYPGITVEANIVIREKQNALVIPREYLQAGDSVLVQQDEVQVKIKVKPGLRGEQMVEIEQGLTAESKLVRPS